MTLEDPLVSRQHAKIVVDEAGATVEDLGSRNGVRVNAVPARGRVAIKDGDRVRIGTQEFVLSELSRVPVSPIASKTTGFLRHCARCRLPVPQEVHECPACGSTERVDDEDDTLTGQLGPQSKRSWGVELLLEVLQRAVATQRAPDAARTLQKIATQLEEIVDNGDSIEDDVLTRLSELSVRTSEMTKDPIHARFCIGIYTVLRKLPPAAVTDELALVAVRDGGALRASLEELVQRGRTLSGEKNAEALARLERLLEALAPSSGADDTGVKSKSLS
ncbi:hypothetical protein BH09MYX1_BH09MYX1_46510 [soil metagenome]